MGHSSVSFHFRASEEAALNTHLAERGISWGREKIQSQF